VTAASLSAHTLSRSAIGSESFTARFYCPDTARRQHFVLPTCNSQAGSGSQISALLIPESHPEFGPPEPGDPVISILVIATAP